MAKVFRINNFEAKKKALVQKICENGGFAFFNNPIEIKIADFSGRLNGDLIPQTVHIKSLLVVGGALKLRAVEDLELGVMVSDLYDGNDMVKLMNAI